MKIKPLATLLLAASFLLAGGAVAAVDETETTFTTADVQGVLDKLPKSRAWVEGLIRVSLEDSPVVQIGRSPGRIGLSARLLIQVAGAKPVPASISGSGGLVYDASSRSFFLAEPLVESMQAPFIPEALEEAARAVITRELVRRFSESPVYVLRENGPMKERNARQLLKSIQIRRDAVVARFALK